MNTLNLFQQLSKVEDEDNLEFSLEPPRSNDVEELFSGGFRSSFVPYKRDAKDKLDQEDDVDEKEESLYSSDDNLSDDLEFERYILFCLLLNIFLVSICEMNNF